MNVADLLRNGLTPPGMDPMVIEQPGGAPTIGGDISPLARVARAVQSFVAKAKMDDEERQKKLKDQSDMYNTLRDSGYSPQQAHDAVLSGNLPKDIPGLTNKDKESSAKIDALKLRGQQDQARTDAYVASKQSESTLKDALAVKAKSLSEPGKSDVEAGIMAKLASGQELTQGELDIYENVIKKKNPAGLAEILAGGNGPTDRKVQPIAVPTGDKVRVQGPDGKIYSMPKENLEKAKQRGYKQVQ